MPKRSRVGRQVIRSMRLDCHRVIRLTETGERSREMVEVMRDALRLFVENRLHVAVPFSTPPMKSDKELLQLCSLPISAMGLSRPTEAHLEARGIRYVGEICLVRYDRHLVPRQEIEGWMDRHGLSIAQDPLARGWRPPYASDPAARDIWNKPLDILFAQKKINFEDLWAGEEWTPRYFWWWVEVNKRGVHYVGELFAPERRVSSWLKSAQLMMLHSLPQLHAGMRTVRWVAPFEPPPVWERYQTWSDEMVKNPGTTRHTWLLAPHPLQRRSTDEQRAFLARSVGTLELSVRSSNALRAMGIETIGQLVEMSERGLLQQRNFGRKSLKEITDILEECGLSLKG